ncbi:hypothetical protein H0R92_11105 [Treponema sp. OMZ 840]|uniref:permease prefix domain 1-containing protein n=1 Tax=Treponema sp. OMZ 840 TaxID=244313 RepID=UPI003D8C2374
MSKKIAEYVNFIFRNAPNTREAMELKEEIENNVSDKYDKLVAGGLDEEQAFSKAIASIGNIDELLDELKRSAAQESSAVKEFPAAESENRQKKEKKMIRVLLEAAAIMLFVLCPVPVIMLSDEIGVVWMFVFIACGTGILIFSSLFKTRQSQDDIGRSFAEYKNHYKPKRRLFRKTKSLIWSCTILLYLIISFLTGRWDITWIIFIISGIGVSILDIGMDED